MALPPGNPDTFMREVDDAVRADVARDFAARFGKPLIALLVVGLIALAGWLYWQSRTQDSSGALGTQLSAVLDTMGQQRPKAAATAADALAKGDDPTYRALALMVQGNAAMAQGDMRGAAAKFSTVAANPEVDQALRDTALLRQMLAEYETIEPATLIARLRHLVATPGPAFASAAELTALAELKRGNDRAAGLLFKRIAEAEDVPDSLKSRAVQMAGMLGVDAVTDDENTAATPSAPATKTGE
jgi:hypothetical protein